MTLHSKTQVTDMKPKPPKVPGWPIMGHWPPFFGQGLDFLKQSHTKYGDIFSLELGGTEMVILTHPEQAHHVLLAKAHNYQTKGGNCGFRVSSVSLGGDGVTTTANIEEWQQQRRLIQSYFHKKQWATFTETMTQVIETSLGQWESKLEEPINLALETNRIAMKAVVKNILGVNIETPNVDKLVNDIKHALSYIWLGTLAHLKPKWLPMPGLHSYQQAIKSVDEQVYQLLEQALAQKGEHPSLIKQFWQMDQAKDVSKKQLRDKAVNLLIGASEALPAMLAFSFALLVQHPTIAQKLQTEIDTTLGVRQATLADIPQLKYARMISQETLRLYAPIYWIQRMATKADEIDGFYIPAGTIVVIMPYLLHYHPKIWDNPTQFQPERFSPEQIEARHKLAWLPFGAGQRVCSGAEYSLMFGQLLLAQVLQRYRLKAKSNFSIGIDLNASVSPKAGVWVNLEKRS